MKVAFITEDIFGDSIGGVEQHIYNIALCLAKNNTQIKILSLKAGKSSSKNHEIIKVEGGIDIDVVRITKRNILFSFLGYLEKKIPGKAGMAVALLGKLLPNFHFRSLLNEIKIFNPDIVHQHDYLANIFASKIISIRRPTIFTNHTGQYLFLEKNFFTRILQRFLIRHYKSIIGPSSELTPDDRRATYITNGVDTAFFDGAKKKLVDNKIVFICPRRWAPTKGVLFLVRAMKEISYKYKDKALFLFAGSDSDDYPWYRDEILDVLDKLPKEMYELLGNLNQEDLRKYFLRSDVVIIPSLMEATSLAAMEGMAAGLPVLSTNVGGMPDVVVNDSVGWLVDPSSSEQLANILKEIIESKYDLDSMGISSKNYVQENKSWQIISLKVLKIYNKVLDKEKL